jgi:hypothetical protein
MRRIAARIPLIVFGTSAMASEQPAAGEANRPGAQ